MSQKGKQHVAFGEIDMMHVVDLKEIVVIFMDLLSPDPFMGRYLIDLS